MPGVTRIVEYQNRELVKVLEDWLEQAKSGEITGIAYAVRVGFTQHEMGLVGTYIDDPIPAAIVVAQLYNSITDHAIHLGTIKRAERGER
jgi:uncharacterized protein (DUF2164 family)